MFRTNTCGELRLADAGKTVTLAGWVQRTRKMGGMTFVDIRDRYGITQLVFNEEINADLCEQANKLGREYVIQATGTVSERESKNKNLPTGEVEIIVSELNVLNVSKTPPFTIEDNSDGGDDIRMKYRYLDLRRNTYNAVELLQESSLNIGRIVYDNTVKTRDDSIKAVVYRQTPEPSEYPLEMGAEVIIYLTTDHNKIPLDTEEEEDTEQQTNPE